MRRKKFDNFTLFTLEGVLFLTGVSWVSYETVMPKIVESLGGSPMMITLTPILFIFTSALPTVFLAGVSDRLKRKIPFLVPMCFMQRIPFLVVALILWFSSNNMTNAYAILIAVFFVGLFSGISAPFWNSVCGDTVPRRYIPRLFAIRFGITSILGVVVGILMKFILEWFPGRAGFGILFFLAGLMMLGSLYYLSLIYEPQSRISQHKPKLNPPAWREVWQNRNIINFSWSRIFFSATYISIGFIPVKICKELELNDSWLGIFTIMVVLGAISGNIFTIMWSKRMSLKSAQIISLAGYMATFVLTIFCRNIVMALFIFFLFGFAKDAWNSVCSSLIIGLPGKRLRAKGSAFMAISMAPALLLSGMIGAWLYELSGTYVVPLLASTALMIPAIIYSNRIKEQE